MTSRVIKTQLINTLLLIEMKDNSCHNSNSSDTRDNTSLILFMMRKADDMTDKVDVDVGRCNTVAASELAADGSQHLKKRS